MAHTLYKLTFPNGKLYIGQTIRTMTIRLNQHRNSAKAGSLLPVHCAWRKHGAPSVETLGLYATDDELHEAEIAAIMSFGSRVPNGYNLSFGGDTAPSKAPEVAAKISAAAIGRIRDPEINRRVASELWESKEYREKQGAALRASWSPERRAEASARSKKMWEKRKAAGWTMPEETRRKLADRIVSEESRSKMSAASKGRKRPPRSEETKEKIRSATKAAWRNREVTERRVAAIRAALAAKGE